MPFIRYKDIGPTTVISSKTFIQVDLSNGIDLSQFVTIAQLQVNPLHLVSKWSVVDESGCIGNFYTFHLTIYHDGTNYAYGGIAYGVECPIETESSSDWADFELSTEGIYLKFSGDVMTIYGSMRSPNGINLTVRSYVEFYVEGNV